MKLVGYNELNGNVEYEQIAYQLADAIRMVEVSIHDQDIDCAVPKHWHRGIEVIVPIHGATETWIDGRAYHVEPGHFLIVNSRNIHSCRCVEPHQDYYGFAIQIRYEFLEQCFEKFSEYEFDTYYEGEALDEINAVIGDMVDTYKVQQDFSGMKFKALAYQLVYLLLKHVMHPAEHPEVSSDNNRNRLSEVLNYIDDNYQNITDVQEIAETFHMSYGHLAQLFRSTLHTTITEYLNSVRIRHIENDLLTTDLPVSEICLKHGYDNTKSFYREFRKRHDMTPKEYRRG